MATIRSRWATNIDIFITNIWFSVIHCCEKIFKQYGPTDTILHIIPVWTMKRAFWNNNGNSALSVQIDLAPIRREIKYQLSLKSLSRKKPWSSLVKELTSRCILPHPLLKDNSPLMFCPTFLLSINWRRKSRHAWKWALQKAENFQNVSESVVD